MFRILLVTLCLSGTFAAFSQDPSKEMLAPCGTPAGVSPWLRAYTTHSKTVFSERSEETLWVALQVHLLTRDNGTGRLAYDRVLDAICRLNTDYAPANIQFYLKNSLNVINRSEWYIHQTIPQGIDMMLTSNVEGALNSYFVSDPAGNCGYNLPYAGVAIGHGCSSPTDHTWAHEAGHALSLPHPFIGWEGKTYSFSLPTPELLTYDYTHFHDSLEVQVPAPLDTALVELLDGSNCSIAADLICDTKPDYLSYRWNCNAQNLSTIKLKDPNGAEFYADGSLFMSYADDACQSRFSSEEIAAMRANLMTEKASWVAPAVLESPVTSLPVAIEPVQNQLSPFIGTTLVWTSVPNATYYLVQASRISSFALREVDVITSDTSLVLGQFPLNIKYYWRVKAFNSWDICADFTEPSTFITAPVSATQGPDWEGWRCYPSLIAAGQRLQLEIPASWKEERAQVEIFDVAGRLVWKHYPTLQGPKMSLELPSESWISGLYYFVLTTNKGVKRQPLLLTR
jgi:hypothetical protein